MAINITFLAGYYEPDISADTHLNSSLCNGLSKKGYNVNVVAPFPSRGISNAMRVKYSGVNEEINEYGVNILRIGKSTYKQNIVLRGIDFIRKTILMYKSAKKIDTDYYIIMSTPPFLGLISSFLPKNAVKIYRLQDIFPDSLINAGIIKNRGFIFKFLKYLEQRIYYGNDLIITVSHEIKRQLIARGVSSSKIKVVYNWIDEEKCVPIKKEENYLYDEFKLDREKFNVVYAGNIGHLQNIETIVKTAEYLKHRKDIMFIIIGDGVLKQKIQDSIENKSLKNIRLFSMQPLERVPYVYSLGDVGLVSLKEGVSKSALPSKTWSIMSAGRPVICEIDANSELNDILIENRCGICIEPGDYVSMAKAIMKFLDSPNLLYEMSANARQFIVEHVSEKYGISQFVESMIGCSARKGETDQNV